jgi:hypothetical protein
VTSSHPEADGRRRAEQFLRLLAEDGPASEKLLADLTDVRELVFLGAGLTALARTESRELPPAQRAQASTRQVRLGHVRDANRDDVAGLRTWLRQAGEEVLFVRALLGTSRAAAH